MRREEYERSYGRRSHHSHTHVSPPLPSSQEDPRSRRSRTKMKCLISIGLILPALAAVIGVAAWAVSADVVMNSGNNRGGAGGRGDNNLLQQNYGIGNDNRPDIYRLNNVENQRLQPRPQEPSTTSTTSSTTTTTTSTTTTTTTTPPPQTLSPKEATDVNAILSKLISASGAASGGNGPRFVVVAPLPDNADVLQGQNSQSGIARVDHAQRASEKPKENSWQQVSKPKEHDLETSASSLNPKVSLLPPPKAQESSGRSSIAKKEVNRRMSEKSSINSHGPGFHVDLTGFEPFDSMMQPETLMGSSSVQHQHGLKEQHHGFPHGSTFKRGPPQGFFGSRNPHHGQLKDQHLFNPPRMPEHGVHTFQANHPPGLGIGLKPIQQQLHHIDTSGPLQTSESSRWGTIGFPGGYVHKPPEGISIGISSPAGNGAHVSSEPVSVIKSFFLPFLPKPRLNMNARVVFGVVLDKGLGVGANKKDGPHHLG